VLSAVDEQQAYANLALGKALDKYALAKLDRSLATELVYGVLRSQNTLDWALSPYMHRPLYGLKANVRNILRLGAYQILFMDKIPDSAGVNEAANLARRYGHEGIVKFVNGVLRNLARGKEGLKFPDPDKDPEQYLSLRYAHPLWLASRWYQEFGLTEAETLCAFNNQPAPNTLRVNTLKTSLRELMLLLEGLGVQASNGKYATDCLHLQDFGAWPELAPFREGLCTVQDESSILVGQALSPHPGSYVLDAAAAPGGKTTHLAQLMANKGCIVALDIHKHKMKLIAANCKRLGVQIVTPILADARQIPEKFKHWADYVLLDAPCSGLGVLRRRPDSRWRKDPSNLPPLVALQAQLLDSVAEALKAGGVLVYSTCTINSTENIAQMDSFLKRHPDFKVASLKGLLPDELDLDNTLSQGYLQILPQRHGLDGFFIARLEKDLS